MEPCLQQNPALKVSLPSVTDTVAAVAECVASVNIADLLFPLDPCRRHRRSVLLTARACSLLSHCLRNRTTSWDFEVLAMVPQCVRHCAANAVVLTLRQATEVTYRIPITEHVERVIEADLCRATSLLP